jgi:hypothetical protein
MLTIREMQMRALTDDVWRRLIVKHVQECFPKQFEQMGESTVSDIAQRARKKARAYGFTRLADQQQYVDLVVVLGEDFESAPEYTWTREILEDRNAAGGAFRATWLYDSVTRHLAAQEQNAGRS